MNPGWRNRSTCRTVSKVREPSQGVTSVALANAFVVELQVAQGFESAIGSFISATRSGLDPSQKQQLSQAPNRGWSCPLQATTLSRGSIAACRDQMQSSRRHTTANAMSDVYTAGESTGYHRGRRTKFRPTTKQIWSLRSSTSRHIVHQIRHRSDFPLHSSVPPSAILSKTPRYPLSLPEHAIKVYISDVITATTLIILQTSNPLKPNPALSSHHLTPRRRVVPHERLRIPQTLQLGLDLVLHRIIPTRQRA